MAQPTAQAPKGVKSRQAPRQEFALVDIIRAIQFRDRAKTQAN